jgi:phospholipid/cholesterol/gamma-HCH transport system substrate-binding protein
MSTARTDDKEQQRFWNEFRIGVLAVGAIALLFLGVRFLQGTPLLGSTYALIAQFESADGIAEGTPVTVRGLPVGTVEDVSLSEKGGVRARLRIQEDVRLTEGTTASIRGLAALDDVSVSLQRTPGGEPLAAGARIPTAQGGTLDQLRKRAVPIAQRVDSALAEATGTFSEARSMLGGSESDVETLLTNLRSASAGVESFVQGERDRLRRVLAHLEETSASMETLAEDLEHVAGTNRDTLEQTVQDAERTAHHTRKAAQSLEQSAQDLEVILSGLRRGKGTAGQLLNDPRLYRRLNSISVRVDSILADFQRRPGYYLDTTVEIF